MRAAMNRWTDGFLVSPMSAFDLALYFAYWADKDHQPQDEIEAQKWWDIWRMQG